MTYAGNAWVGIGFIEGQSVSMTGGSGGGADTFICSGTDAMVMRYWKLVERILTYILKA